MSFHVPERFRITDARDPRAHTGRVSLATGPDAGNNGLFHVPPKVPGRELRVIASDGEGWEHVSVSIVGTTKTPTWAEMDYVARLFWDAEDAIVQFHPPRSEHVNYHEGCLHLWRPIGVEIPRPAAILVGPGAGARA